MTRAAWRLRERLATRRERQARSKFKDTDSPEMIRRVNDSYAAMRQMQRERHGGVRRGYRVLYKKHVDDTALHYDSVNDALGNLGVDYDASRVQWRTMQLMTAAAADRSVRYAMRAPSGSALPMYKSCTTPPCCTSW